MVTDAIHDRACAIRVQTSAHEVLYIISVHSIQARVLCVTKTLRRVWRILRR